MFQETYNRTYDAVVWNFVTGTVHSKVLLKLWTLEERYCYE
jgi:hypothetical protein